MNTYDHIEEQLTALLNGNVWYGENLVESIAEINFEQSLFRINGTIKNIAEILYHLTSWNNFVVAKLDSEEEFEIKLNSEEDWKKIENLNEQSWQQMKKKFFQSYQEILDHYEGMERSGLVEKVPGRTYNFRFLMQGIIQHNIYHLAQINFIKSCWALSH